ncbi:MAG: hypothetical protein VX544_01490 [Pseudomonadota bacterium]|nr:hypothetical protein [Pseudomonadota bacterium]
MVLSFPKKLTFKEFVEFKMADHSLRADTINSLKTIKNTGMNINNLVSLYSINNKAVITRILSATGSKNFPSKDTCSSFLAAKPSKKSVIEAKINMSTSIELLPSLDDEKK